MKILLIVDLQKQFKLFKEDYIKILNKLKSIERNYDKIFATVFSQSVEGNVNKNYIEKLNWHDCYSCSEKDLEFDTSNKEIIIKNGYGIHNIEKYFSKEDDIDIIGCDSDACVMAICFQLFDLGYNFNVLSDYIYTSSSSYTNHEVIKFLKRNFGSCIK